ncbi:MAG: efflux RND transporter periplasmic adaptor subunit [Candidatus Riflebacteria bacterium]|nr:efflux RND transporter periplasmic adaptor subunit [Candidatus Riflebacteria bacterium]
MRKWLFWICLLLVVTAIPLGGWFLYRRMHKPPQWKTEEIDRGEIKQAISATGSLAALTTVEVGCQISGILASVTADFNNVVKAGQQIAQIDPSTYEAQLQQSTANIENARAAERNIAAQVLNQQAILLSARADIMVQKANIRKAEVSFEDAVRNQKRTEDLFARNLVAASDRDTATSNADALAAALEAAKAQLESSKAKVSSTEAQIDATKAQLEGAAAQIRQMEAQCNVSKINLERTKIFSPIDGVVISRAVDVGQTVAASLQAPTLFTIANDLKLMQINTAVDEADIGNVKEGQPVTFTVDAYRGRTFQGTVGQVRLSPTITQNVVTYSVMVNVKNDDLSLKPGMTANVEILVESHADVLRIPTQALFFKPPADMFARKGNRKPHENAEGYARIWTIASENTTPARLMPIDIKLGLSNNTLTEIIASDVSPGMLIVTGEKKPEDTAEDKGPNKGSSGSSALRQVSRIH